MPTDPDLGQRIERYVSSLVKAGRFGSRSEVLREGVRLVEEREKRVAAFDAAIARGLDDVQAGRVKPAAEIAARLGAKYRAMTGREDEC